MGASSQKELLVQYNHARVQGFNVNDDLKMALPRPSMIPGYAASNYLDIYKKTIMPLGEKSRLKFITKNGHSQSFVWESTTEKIREGARWNIIKAESLTGKAINAMGEYRLIAQERIVRGLVSNTHLSKIALVELFQRQAEALQDLESLVNLPNNTVSSFETAINSYKTKLDQIKADLPEIFKDTLIRNKMDATYANIEKDIEKAKKRADNYLKKETFKHPENTPEICSLATGNDSIQQFVKRQLLRNFYSTGGINKDLTHIDKRERAAISSGEFNSCIEDGIKEIMDYDPDVVNSIRPEHHGIFGEPGETICYDFNEHHLSPDDERKALLAISAIEGRDKVLIVKDEKTGRQKAVLESKTDDAAKCSSGNLKVIAATAWTTTTGPRDTWSRIGHGALKMIKSTLFSTRPWNGRPWGNLFKPYVFKLWDLAKPNEPLWSKPYRFLVLIGNNIMDLVLGIKDLGASLSFNIPNVFKNDWKATRSFEPQIKADSASEILRMYKSEDVNKNVEQLNKEYGYEITSQIMSLKKKRADIETKIHTLKPDDQSEQALKIKKERDQLKEIEELIIPKLAEKHAKNLYWKKNRVSIESKIRQIKTEEETKLDSLFENINKKIYLRHGEAVPHHFSKEDLVAEANKHFPRLAGFHFHRSAIEQSDILTEIAHGLYKFENVFTHNIYAKQPIPALIFTLIYATGAASILAPELLKVLGPEVSQAILDFYNALAPILGKNPISQAAGASTSTAQLATMLVETILNGPNSWLATAFDQFCNDPLTALAYFAAAYGLGYALTNVFESIKDEMGTLPPIFSNTMVGGKFSVLLIEFFMRHKEHFLNSVSIKKQQKKIAELQEEIIKLFPTDYPANDAINASRQISQIFTAKASKAFDILKQVSSTREVNQLFEKIKLTALLAHHQATLPKLSNGKKFAIEQKAKELLSKSEAASLCKLLYPEKPLSIAYQLFVIPLSYIPAILRCLVSPFISIVALIAKRDDPAAPIRNSFTALWHKSARDLVRLLVFGKKVVDLIYNPISTMLKLPVVIGGMIVGLVLGAFGISTSQALYKGLGEMNIFIGRIGGFFKHYLGIDSAIKSVQSPHQNETLSQVRGTYETLKTLMPENKSDHSDSSVSDSSDSEVDEEDNESHAKPANDDVIINMDDEEASRNALKS